MMIDAERPIDVAPVLSRIGFDPPLSSSGVRGESDNRQPIDITEEKLLHIQRNNPDSGNDSLTAQINAEHALAQQGMVDAVSHAWACGALLKAKKAEVGHGNWLPWVEANFAGSHDTSTDYMRLHDKYPELPNIARGRNLSIKGLLAGPGHGFTSESNEWYTPRDVIDAVYLVMGGIDLDPASCEKANEVIQAGNYFTESDDGLKQEWRGRVFLNPPYGGLAGEFMGKLYESLGSGVTEAIALLNAGAVSNLWFHECFNGVLCFPGRLKFGLEGDKKGAPVNGSVLVYFGPNERRFAEVFSGLGAIVKRWPDAE